MNEVKILIRVQNSGKAGLEDFNKDVDTYAQKFAETFSRRFSDNLTQNITRNLRTVVQQADAGLRDTGDRIGDTIGQRAGNRITERIRNVFNNRNVTNGAGSGGLADRDRVSVNERGDRDRVHVDVDVDKPSLMTRVAGLGKEAGEKFGSFFGGGFKSTISSVFGSDLVSLIVKALAGSGLVLGIAPILGAAFTAAVGLSLGGGVIAAGVLAAFRDPRIKSSFKFLADVAKGEFALFGQNFIEPTQRFADGLADVFNQIRPMIEHLGKVFAPVADSLASGLVGLLQNALPGILRATESSAPIVKMLADKLPMIGDSIGKFFDHIRQHAPEAKVFLGDLLELVGLLIRIIGILISGFTRLYYQVRTVFVGLINLAGDFLTAATSAFGWIPGIGPKLAAAEKRFGQFRDKLNASMAGIDKNITINVRFRILGQAAANAAIRTAQLLGHASGGIQGAADGGMRSGLTWVGEQGPELVKLPPGAQVNTAGDSRRMAAQGGQDGELRLKIEADRNVGNEVVDVLFKLFRGRIRAEFGGNVQSALGTS